MSSTVEESDLLLQVVHVSLTSPDHQHTEELQVQDAIVQTPTISDNIENVKPPKASKSFVWKYFEFTDQTATRVVCKFCESVLKYNKTTSTMIKHLTAIHKDAVEGEAPNRIVATGASPSTLKRRMSNKVYRQTAAVKQEDECDEDMKIPATKRRSIMHPTKGRIDKKIGFIGAGKMVQALAISLINSGTVQAGNVYVSAPSSNNCTVFQENGVHFTNSNMDVANISDILFIAVKSHIVPVVLQELADGVSKDKLIVSLATGISLHTIYEFMQGTSSRIIRGVTNTPVIVHSGVFAFSRDHPSTASFADCDLVERLMSSIAICHQCSEQQLDIITGLCGSGPAYIFMIVEALADGAVKMGLSRPFATKLAAQTVMGAARMVIETETHPGILKDDVCSPCSPTISAVHELEKCGIRSAMISAVETATLKAQELGKPLMRE